MKTKNIIKSVYILISIIVTVQFIILTCNYILTTKRAVLEENKIKLIEIVTRLENKLPKAFDELIGTADAGSTTTQEKITILNTSLQPIINQFALQWPGYEMGYYSIDHKIVALAPFNQGLLGKSASPETLKLYEQKELQITDIRNGFTWGGYTLLAVNDPLYVNGKLIGHVWSNIKIENINNAFLGAIYQNLIIYLLIWLAIILTIRWLFAKIEKSIAQLIEQINSNSEVCTQFTGLPQLVPVLKTVHTLRNRLQKEFEERHRIQNELSRLDRLNIVGQMAATVAHEIRNPMTVVMGYIQLMAGKNKKSSDEYALITEELKRVNHIIEEFLSLARIKEAPKSPTQLNDIIQSTYPLIYAESVNKGIEVSLDLQPDLPLLFADEKELKQVILNLACNSIDVMDSSGTLRIATRYSKGEDDIYLSISDTGCGIAQENLDKIFSPFFTTKQNGTGLGLCVCKNIIERHNGTISVNSKLGQGSTLTVRLPRADLQFARQQINLQPIA